MRKPRRYLLILAALLLGVIAWIAVLPSTRFTDELRLSRELGSGRLLTRVTRPKSPLSILQYGPARLEGRVIVSDPFGEAEFAVPSRAVFAVTPVPGTDEEIWYINLDPLDKSWDLIITETRPVALKAAPRKVVGSKTRMWRTQRRERSDL